MVIKILNKKCRSTSSIAKDFFFSFSKHTTHVLLLHKFHCKSFFFLYLSKHNTHILLLHKFHCKRFFFFFFSFSKHTTHIHLKSSTPSTLKPQRHKRIKIQNKTFFFFFPAIQPAATLQFNQLYNSTIFFSLSTSIPSGLNALSLLFNFSTFLFWKA